MIQEKLKPQKKADAFSVSVAVNDDRAAVPVAADNVENDMPSMGAITINVPSHAQPSLDAILDHYAQTGAKPDIKLCGNPLEIVSNFIEKMQETLPPHLVNSGKDILDYMINSLCDFCRSRKMNHMTLQFKFERSNCAEVA